MSFYFFFFFNDTATTEIYTLSLHDALPILRALARVARQAQKRKVQPRGADILLDFLGWEMLSNFRVHRVHKRRSEEHTSELQSQSNLVCRLLLEKKKNKISQQNRVSRTLSR